VPLDIADSYPKTEETFSLRTKDGREALETQPPQGNLTDEHIKHIDEIDYAFRLEEDDDVRHEAFKGRSFKAQAQTVDDLDA